MIYIIGEYWINVKKIINYYVKWIYFMLIINIDIIGDFIVISNYM